MAEIKEIKKKGRPSKQDNILTKNAFEKKEEPLVPIEEKKVELPLIPPAPTAPNSPIQTPVQTHIVPVDMPKPKKERSEAQMEATKKMLEANKLKKANKTVIIIKEEPKKEPKEEPKEDPKVEPKKEPKKKPKEEPKVKPNEEPKVKPKEEPKKVKKPVKYETSSEEDSDSSSEEKYIKKVTKKLELVNSIEARLKQNAIPRNKYSTLSIFS